MDMKRIINTHSKEIDLTRTYAQGHDIKPKGLWYGIDNEWLDWCEGNMEEWIKNEIIELDVDLSKMLILETPDQLKAFSDKYSYEIIPHSTIKYIDWAKIAQDYSGIEIRNYYDLKYYDQFMRWEVWFMAWDVSSGCIWDLSIIKSFSHSELKK